MNHASKLFVSPILVFLLFCNFSWASDVCGDGAGYPDQYPFKNCGSVSTLTWDQANSCEELADNSSCTVAVAGGQGPYTWTISGTGFSFASGQTSIQTSENTVTVFTQDACGAGSITVTDSCRSVNGGIKSTQGVWLDRGTIANDMHCWGHGHPNERIEGKYKYTYQSAGGEEAMVSGYNCTHNGGVCAGSDFCDPSQTVCLDFQPCPDPYDGSYCHIANGVAGRGYRTHLCAEGLPSYIVTRYNVVYVNLQEWVCE